ncbi:hypothetical protein DPMN_183811 [Dreissena polymorpha]|uniref:Uncharacterized protein n=1 Tax=Dreissena polymorpha TaxID=45954 RepID=A0A9D4DJ41_DREPO|nr:hypothetical protein DPMN_183811 [Dreissena polymorpha]
MSATCFAHNSTRDCFSPSRAGCPSELQFDPRCSFYDLNFNDPDVWVFIVIREMSIRSVVYATSVSTSPDNRYDITSSITSWRWMPSDSSSSSSTDSDTSSTETSSSERTVNSFVKEALVQAASNADTNVEPTFHSEDNDDYSENVEYCTGDVYEIVPKCHKDYVDDIFVDNSCAWFWCKTHRDEVQIIENPKYVRRINKEVTQNATAPVVECDPHLPNTTCVESYKLKKLRVLQTRCRMFWIPVYLPFGILFAPPNLHSSYAYLMKVILEKHSYPS